MRRRVAALTLSLFALAAHAAPPPEFVVGDATYRLRWTGDSGLAEYTPDGQEDLDRYADMISFAATPAALRPEDMPGYARAMADDVGAAGGDVLSQECVPDAVDHAAECTMFAAYARPEFTEFAFTRLVAVGADNVASLVLSHREYGRASEAQARDWLASSAGQARVAGFLDWTSRLALRRRARAASPAPAR